MPTPVASTVIDLITNGTISEADLEAIVEAINIRRGGHALSDSLGPAAIRGAKIRLVAVRPKYLKGMTGTLGKMPGQLTREAMFVTPEEVARFPQAKKYLRGPVGREFISVKPSMYEVIP